LLTLLLLQQFWGIVKLRGWWWWWWCRRWMSWIRLIRSSSPAWQSTWRKSWQQCRRRSWWTAWVSVDTGTLTYLSNWQPKHLISNQVSRDILRWRQNCRTTQWRQMAFVTVRKTSSQSQPLPKRGQRPNCCVLGAEQQTVPHCGPVTTANRWYCSKCENSLHCVW